MAKTRARRESDDYPPKEIHKIKKVRKILTLKESVLAIRAYFRQPVYTKIAKKFKCDWPQIKAIIQDRNDILDYYEMATTHFTRLTGVERTERRQNIAFLEVCLNEYVQRAHYHKPAMLDNKNLLRQATEFSYLLRIKSFIATRSWLDRYKRTYKIPAEGQPILLSQVPPTSLSPKKIIAYCKLELEAQPESKQNLEDSQQLAQESDGKDSQVGNISRPAFANVINQPLRERETQKQRRQKINLLEKALYEFIQRAQYHHNIMLNEDLHFETAVKFSQMLKIGNFTPNRNWMKHFKLHYNIGTSQRMILVNRVPAASLELEDILRYCSASPDAENHNQSTHEAFEIKVEQMEEQPNAQTDINFAHSIDQPSSETIVTLEYHTADDLDIKPDETDIQLELVEDVEAEEQPTLRIRQIDSMYAENPVDPVEQQIECSGHNLNNKDIEPSTSHLNQDMKKDDYEVARLSVLKKPVLVSENPVDQAEQLAESSVHDLNEEGIKPSKSDLNLEMNEDAYEEAHSPILIKPVLKTYGARRSKSSSENEKILYFVRQETKNNVTLQAITIPTPIKHEKTNKSQEKSYAKRRILSLEEQVQIIEASQSKTTISKIAKKFKCEREDIRKILQKTRMIMECHRIHLMSSMLKKRSVVFLGKCMCEFMRRAEYHARAKLNDEVLISIATQMSTILQIRNFIASNQWLEHIKEMYNKQRTASLHSVDISIPSASFCLHHIMKYCKHEESLKKTSTLKNPVDELRQQKIETLERALYEYIRRLQYHQKRPLDEEKQIKVAKELNSILMIDKFMPNKGWLKHFKLHFNISTSQRMIVVDNEPPTSLDLRDILNYCLRGDDQDGNQSNFLNLATTIAVDHNEEHEKNGQQSTTQHVNEGPQSQIDTDLAELTEQNQIEVATEQPLERSHDTAAEDIKPIVMDIKIELPEVQSERRIVDVTQETNQTTLKTVSPLIDHSSDDEVLPKITNSYVEALKKLKSLEEFALLEENYRAIGLITQLENIFKNPSSKSSD